MIDAGGFFAKSAASMTTKTRNWLIALSILAAPFLFSCLSPAFLGRRAAAARRAPAQSERLR